MHDAARANNQMPFRKVMIGPHTLYCGDAWDVLPDLGRFDAMVTDPPYGFNVAKSGRVGGGDSVVAVTQFEAKDWDKTTCDDLVEVMRVTARWQIIFGGNYYRLPPSSCWLVWDKINNGCFADAELAWTNLPKPVRLKRLLWNGMVRVEKDIPRENPTQKPVGIMVWCLSHLPPETRTILDPFMGSGTTGVAAIQAGKIFTEIEREPDYFDMAVRRMREAYAQPKLFELTCAPSDMCAKDPPDRQAELF